MYHLLGRAEHRPTSWGLENIHIILFMFPRWLTMVDYQYEEPFISEGAIDGLHACVNSTNTGRLILELAYCSQYQISPSRAFPFSFQMSILERQEGANNIWIDH